MTEKRFTRIVCSNDEYTGSLFCDDEPLKIDAVCTLLNENEQLKSEKNELLEENITYKNIWLALKDRDNEIKQLKNENQELQGKYDKQLWVYNGLGCEYDGLKAENEQLKQINQRLNDELQECMGKLALKR